MRVIEGAACVPTFAERSRSVLPIELIRKYENECFWLDPPRNSYKVRVV
jgi:hypothetical protein